MFTIDLAMKDLRLALDLAAGVYAGMPQTERNLRVMEEAAAAGLRRSRTSPLSPSTCEAASGPPVSLLKTGPDPSMQVGMRRWRARSRRGRPGRHRRSPSTMPPTPRVDGALLARLPLATYVFGVDGATLYLSPYLEQLLGCRVEEWQQDPAFFLRLDPSGRPGARGRRVDGPPRGRPSVPARVPAAPIRR